MLKHKSYADFVIDDKIILEVKSTYGFANEFYALVLNYLAVSKLDVDLLINFNDKSP
ncbi:GxxExxY protein [Pedobacter sp. Leaf176]|uniref:GxxExxY protein n=1 Tax=Pedobacter sp. Leaf176 TaxID=1736286 RepID=UPI0009EB1CF6